MILTGQHLYDRFGSPSTKRFLYGQLIVWDVPQELEIGFIPKKIYCHRLLPHVLEPAFKALIKTGYVDELKTWDGCWNNRPMRGYEKRYKALVEAGQLDKAWRLLSIHAWAAAVDVNASENGLGVKPKLSTGFVKCWTDAGMDWGGKFKRLDGMHFQITLDRLDELIAAHPQ